MSEGKLIKQCWTLEELEKMLGDFFYSVSPKITSEQLKYPACFCFHDDFKKPNPESWRLYEKLIKLVFPDSITYFIRIKEQQSQELKNYLIQSEKNFKATKEGETFNDVKLSIYKNFLNSDKAKKLKIKNALMEDRNINLFFIGSGTAWMNYTMENLFSSDKFQSKKLKIAVINPIEDIDYGIYKASEKFRRHIKVYQFEPGKVDLTYHESKLYGEKYNFRAAALENENILTIYKHLYLANCVYKTEQEKKNQLICQDKQMTSEDIQVQLDKLQKKLSKIENQEQIQISMIKMKELIGKFEKYNKSEKEEEKKTETETQEQKKQL